MKANSWPFNGVSTAAALPVRSGAVRDFFRYDVLGGSPVTVTSNPMGYVTNFFHNYCRENGVQCTITTDPRDFQKMFHFRSFSDKLVRIEYGGETRYLEPNESVTLKMNEMDLIYGDGNLKFPKITLLNNGLSVDPKVLEEKFY